MTHWVNVVVLLVLLMSGLQIFNAHPALYLGSKSNFDDPVMAMRPMRHGEDLVGVTTIAGWNIDTTNVFGLAYMPDGDYEVRGFPWSVTLPGHRDLSTGRRWHFFFAWLFVINGLDLSQLQPSRAGISARTLRRAAASSSISAPPFGSICGSSSPKARRPSATTCCRSSPISSWPSCFCR